MFHVEFLDREFDEEYINEKRTMIAEALDISMDDTRYFISQSKAQKDMYDINDDHITMLFKDGTTRDVTEVSELLNVDLLSKNVGKYYLCYQRI